MNPGLYCTSKGFGSKYIGVMLRRPSEIYRHSSIPRCSEANTVPCVPAYFVPVAQLLITSAHPT